MLSRLPLLGIALAVAGCSSLSDAQGTDDAGTSTPDSSTGHPGTTLDGGASAVDGSSPSPDGGTDNSPDASAPEGSVDAGPPGKQSLIWIWQGYSDAMDKVTANAKSFTQVSPALYQLNFAYTSGVAKLVNENDNFDGLASADFAKKAHAAGLACIPLMYAGAGNFGTDDGIQNVLNDTNGAQKNFIDAMVQEAVDKGYDGYNLDWEVNNTGYAQYGTKLISFLSAFTSALHAKGMTSSFDLGGWYIRQCTGAGNDGLVDLAAIGHSVDWMIQEDYAGKLGTPKSSCPATNQAQIDCESDFYSYMDVMCNLPPSVVSIGLISTGSNSFAPDALKAVTDYGFTTVAVWPDDGVFLNDSNMPNGSTWYSVLSDWLGK